MNRDYFMKIRSVILLALCFLVARPVNSYAISQKVITYGSVAAIVAGMGGIAYLQYLENKYNEELLKDDLSEERRSVVVKNIQNCRFIIGICGIGAAAGIVGALYGLEKWNKSPWKNKNFGNIRIGRQTGHTYTPKKNKTPTAEVLNQKECTVCFADYKDVERVMLSCGHVCCKNCLNNMLDLSLKEKDTDHFKCPACKEHFDETDVQKVTENRNKLNAFYDVQLKEYLAKDNSVKHCPTPDCPYSFINENNQPGSMKCPACNRQYCSRCLFDHPVYKPCAEEGKPKPAGKTSGKTKNMLDDEWIKNNTKKCPKCNANIQKNGGCLHMECRCGHKFCWVCLGPQHNAAFSCPLQPENKDYDSNNEY